MNPSTKTPEMEAALTDFFGFDRRSHIEANRCAPKPVGCGEPASQFRDDKSRREFQISGLCQNCQDEIWPPPKLEIEPDSFVVGREPMTCGSAEAECRTYKKYRDKKGCVWLVANQEAAAENVYVHDPSDKNSDGFAGRTLRFPLEDGTIYEAKGPWHTNADALFSATGIDVRNTHYTFVVLSKERTSNKAYDTVLKGIVYKDEQPMLGSFYRYKALIEQHPEALFYYSRSSGGSSCGPTKNEINPTKGK